MADFAASAQEPCPCGTPHECIPGSPGCVIEAEVVKTPVELAEAVIEETGKQLDPPKKGRKS